MALQPVSLRRPGGKEDFIVYANDESPHQKYAAIAIQPVLREIDTYLALVEKENSESVNLGEQAFAELKKDYPFLAVTMISWGWANSSPDRQPLEICALAVLAVESANIGDLSTNRKFPKTNLIYERSRHYLQT